MKSSFCKLYFGWLIAVECFSGCIPYINRISSPAAMAKTVYIIKDDFLIHYFKIRLFSVIPIKFSHFKPLLFFTLNYQNIQLY